MCQPSFLGCLMLNEYIGIWTIVFHNGIQNLFTSNLYLVSCENWGEENMPQQGCIINVCSVADTLNCHFHSFFWNITPSSHRNHHPTEQPVSMYSLQPYICCLLCFFCVLKWLPYIWKCHINSIVVCQIHLKFSGSQPTHSLHPPLWAQSAVSVSVMTQALLEQRMVRFWFSV